MIYKNVIKQGSQVVQIILNVKTQVVTEKYL